MAFSNHYFLFTVFFLFLSPCIIAKQSFRPKALVIPVTKDAATNQYVTQIKQRTPETPIDLVVNLGGRLMWVDCDWHYVSTTYRPVRCLSALCSLARANGCGECYSAPKPGCNKNTCGLTPDNSVTGHTTSGELATDIVSVNSTNGSNPGRETAVPRFLFTCGSPFLLKGLAKGVVGQAGFGRNRMALPSQFASAFSFPMKFAMCLTSAGTKGIIILGDAPYKLLPDVQYTSQSLTQTPLFINPVNTAYAYSPGEPSAEYFIGVSSILIDEKAIKLNSTLFSIDHEGRGGTKISTVDPYTVLESSIFKAVTKAFIAARNFTRVAAVKPFSVCYNRDHIPSTRLGAGVPTISLVLQNKNVVWRIFGANSMVQVNDDVMCLAFVDGGSNPMTSIVIGGYQLENNLLQFDLATSKLAMRSLLSAEA